MTVCYEQAGVEEAQKEREQRPCMVRTANTASNVGCPERTSRTHCFCWWDKGPGAQKCCACEHVCGTGETP